MGVAALTSKHPYSRPPSSHFSCVCEPPPTHQPPIAFHPPIDFHCTEIQHHGHNAQPRLSPTPTEPMYTDGAALKRTRPQRMFLETASPDVLLVMRVTDRESDDASAFMDDVQPVPGAYAADDEHGIASVVSTLSSTQRRAPSFDGKPAEDDDDGPEDTSPRDYVPLPDTSSASTLSVASSTSSRSLSVNWTSDQLPRLAVRNYVRLVTAEQDNKGPGYRTALAPPPRAGQGCTEPRSVSDEERDSCPVQQYSVPCDTCRENNNGPMASVY